MFTRNLPLFKTKHNKNPQTLQRVMVRNEVFDVLNNEIFRIASVTKQNMCYVIPVNYEHVPDQAKKSKIIASFQMRKGKKDVYY